MIRERLGFFDNDNFKAALEDDRDMDNDGKK